MNEIIIWIDFDTQRKKYEYILWIEIFSVELLK